MNNFSYHPSPFSFGAGALGIKNRTLIGWRFELGGTISAIYCNLNETRDEKHFGLFFLSMRKHTSIAVIPIDQISALPS